MMPKVLARQQERVVSLVGSIRIPRKYGKWLVKLSCKHRLLIQAAFCVDGHALVFGHQPIKLDVIFLIWGVGLWIHQFELFAGGQVDIVLHLLRG